MRQQFSRVIVKGGVVSPGELKIILDQAERLDLDTIAFGSRQDILFLTQNKIVDNSSSLRLVTPDGDRVENIMSSYVTSDLFASTHWLTGDRYLYILEQFQNTPKLKINIVDPKQRVVPLFTGHLNFIASEQEDYWYLYMRLPHWEKTQMYPVLIYSWDLAQIAEAVERILKEEPLNVEMVFDLVIDATDLNNKTVSSPLAMDFQPFPYCEGMNRMQSGKYWLGLYWRNNKYDIKFLKGLCDLCVTSKIGKIALTPFKSFIVKGIPSEDKLAWEKFLGLSGINVRHSMLELNWHLPVANEMALNLKQFLVDSFNKQDISTYGLTFGIADFDRSGSYFTSIVIERNKPDVLPVEFEARASFNIVYARDFDPNTQDYIVHVQDVDQAELPALLMELSQMYFKNLGDKKPAKEVSAPKLQTIKVAVYQCNSCQTIYDYRFGDQTQNIQPGVLFEKLPNEYCCSLCEGPKENFSKISFMAELNQ